MRANPALIREAIAGSIFTAAILAAIIAAPRIAYWLHTNGATP